MLGALRRCSTVLPRSVAQLSSATRSSAVSKISRPYNAALITRSLHQTSQSRQQTAAVAEDDEGLGFQSEQTENGPITTFAELGQRQLVSKGVVQTLIKDMGLENMTEVQTATINQALNGNDILAQAKTGTGKTLGFLIPVLQNILKTDASLGERRRGFAARRGNRTTADDIRAIIVSPTRELAEQIAVEAKRLVANTSVIVQTAVGGTMKSAGLRAIQREGCHILVGTPGRLKDIFSDKYSGVEAPGLDALVFDEADRLLDQGFWPEIQEIMNLLPKPEEKTRQTLMFSATVPNEVQRLVKQTLRPGFDFVKTVRDDEEPTHARVPQHLVTVNGLENTVPAIVELCKNAIADAQQPDARPFKAIIYFNSTAEVTLASAALTELPSPRSRYRDVPSALYPARIFEIHSRLSQAQRTRASDNFRKCSSGILVSSDVTARGMDFPNVTHVIQVGMPRDRETYIHRIGRTARAGKEGQGWLISPMIEAQELPRKLNNLPLQKDTTLATASVDMTREADVPRSAATVLSQVAEAYKRVPMQLKADAYKGYIGTYGFIRKKALVKAINNLSRYAWGMATPPEVSSKLASRVGLTRVPGMNIDGRIVDGNLDDVDDRPIRSNDGRFGYGNSRSRAYSNDRNDGGRGGFGGGRGGFGDRRTSYGGGDRAGSFGRGGYGGDRAGGDRAGYGGERRGGYGSRGGADFGGESRSGFSRGGDRY
ncbi:DEAD-domain-containing protein [Aureobasidium namibiae CBS 147.97]|uniref:ATP-dependent RNA helicase n=1 Tax=Aureobasidium namibiae CBS 147.97 TaxID=1043004 RepID=A0A074WB15_9PEZI|nr:DEAD-domain-containing protein [Aureobasidium namibiae CBS 147.97]KEQ70113.1 DEAD-domain-containing protein [Aureobasidium namibiae CBS 147.97]